MKLQILSSLKIWYFVSKKKFFEAVFDWLSFILRDLYSPMVKIVTNKQTHTSYISRVYDKEAVLPSRLCSSMVNVISSDKTKYLVQALLWIAVTAFLRGYGWCCGIWNVSTPFLLLCEIWMYMKERHDKEPISLSVGKV